MKKLLTLLAISPLTITSCVSSDEVNEVPEIDTEVSEGDHTGLDEFENRTVDLSQELPSYLTTDPVVTNAMVPDNSWTSVNGVIAPFIAETIDEFQSIIYYQNLINDVNGQLFLSKLFLSDELTDIDVAGVDLDIRARFILNNPFGGESGLGYGTSVETKSDLGLDVSIDMETYFNLNSNLEFCVNTKIEGDANLFDFDVAGVQSLIGTCFDISTGNWSRTYIANNASTGIVGSDVYNSFTQIENTSTGLDIFTWRKTALSEYNRFIRIENNKAYEVSTTSNTFWADKISFSATDENGQLVFESDITENDYNSKWYLSHVDGWSKLDYQEDYSTLYDRFKLELDNGTTHEWNSGAILGSAWGDDDKRFFVNGKDTIKKPSIIGGDFVYTEVIHPYIETRGSKNGYGMFTFPDLSGITEDNSSDIVANGSLVRTAYESYKFNGEGLSGQNVKTFVNKVLNWI